MADLDLLKKQGQIFNCNESGIQLDGRTRKVCIFSKFFFRPWTIKQGGPHEII